MLSLPPEMKAIGNESLDRWDNFEWGCPIVFYLLVINCDQALHFCSKEVEAFAGLELGRTIY